MADIRMPWSKRLVACVDCGYLCYHPGELFEIPPPVRSGDVARTWGYWEGVSCFKYAVNLPRELKVLAENAEEGGFYTHADSNIVRVLLETKRDCRFFYRYQPGYDAPLHRDLEERERRDTAARVWNGVFVLLGGLLTLLVTVVVLLLT